MITRRMLLGGLSAASIFPAVSSRADTASVATAAVAIRETRMVTRLSLEGRLLTVAIDTGGSHNLLRDDVATALRLPTVGTRNLHVSSRGGDYRFVEARAVALDDHIRVAPLVFAVVGAEADLGEGIEGTLSAAFLTGYDNVIDLDAGAWRFYDGGLPALDGWTRVDRATDAGSPYLFATVDIDGQPYRVALDTGMPTATRLFAPAARRSGLVGKPIWSPASPRGEGHLVRASRLELAGRTIERPLVDVQPSGPGGSVYGDGLLGLPVISRFNIAFDARRHALWLRANSVRPAPERYNRAGLWLDRHGAEIRVGIVAPGSPAGTARIEPGDRLENVAWKELIERMDGPAGSVLLLTVEHKGIRRDVSLMLADYL